MCGIIGVVAKTPVNQLLYDGLLILQHRGQDAAGIVTADGANFHSHRGMGMVRDVFRTRNMRSLSGYAGIGHTRYPTAGSASSVAESQPFYVNSPFGIVLAHNGNLTNTDSLKLDLFRSDLRHVNTGSDSEVLLNVLAHELQNNATNYKLDPATIFAAVSGVHRRCTGAYSVVAMIAGWPAGLPSASSQFASTRPAPETGRSELMCSEFCSTTPGTPGRTFSSN